MDDVKLGKDSLVSIDWETEKSAEVSMLKKRSLRSDADHEIQVEDESGGDDL
jgi:hypothetical protein